MMTLLASAFVPKDSMKSYRYGCMTYRGPLHTTVTLAIPISFRCWQLPKSMAL